MVFANNLVGELTLVANAVDLFHPEGLIRPWLTWNWLDGSDLERGRDLLVFDLSDQILISKLIQAIDAQILRHHVERIGEILIHQCRRVAEIAFEELPYRGPPFNIGRRYLACLRTGQNL